MVGGVNPVRTVSVLWVFFPVYPFCLLDVCVCVCVCVRARARARAWLHLSLFQVLWPLLSLTLSISLWLTASPIIIIWCTKYIKFFAFTAKEEDRQKLLGKYTLFDDERNQEKKAGERISKDDRATVLPHWDGEIWVKTYRRQGSKPWRLWVRVS